MSRTIAIVLSLALGLSIGLAALPSVSAEASSQYCRCETSCHALGTCEKSYDWGEVGECASDVYCSRTCTESDRDACGS